MKTNQVQVLLIVGAVAMLGTSALAGMVTPVVYLDMKGNVTNKGTGGSAYNGVVTIGSYHEAVTYVPNASGTPNSAITLNTTTGYRMEYQ